MGEGAEGVGREIRNRMAARNRREHSRQGLGNTVKRRLRGAARGISRGEGVQTILQNIEVTRRKRDRAKVVQAAIHEVKFISFVSRAHSLNHRIKFGERPAIDFHHFTFSDCVPRRIESIQVAECKPRRVAQLAITFGDSLQNLIRAAHVFHVIG